MARCSAHTPQQSAPSFRFVVTTALHWQSWPSYYPVLAACHSLPEQFGVPGTSMHPVRRATAAVPSRASSSHARVATHSINNYRPNMTKLSKPNCGPAWIQFLRQSGPLVAKIFTILPTSPELTFEPCYFRVLLLRRLRLPLAYTASACIHCSNMSLPTATWPVGGTIGRPAPDREL